MDSAITRAGLVARILLPVQTGAGQLDDRTRAVTELLFGNSNGNTIGQLFGE
jgi:hypothetical protein